MQRRTKLGDRRRLAMRAWAAPNGWQLRRQRQQQRQRRMQRKQQQRHGRTDGLSDLRHAYSLSVVFTPKQYRKFIKRPDILNLYVTSQRTGAVTGGCVKKEAPAAGPSSKTFALQFAWMLRKDEALPRSWCPLAAPAPKDAQWCTITGPFP